MDVSEKIESLRVTPSWKEKFKAIAETKPIGGGLKPEFEDEGKYKTLPFWTKFSAWGLLFGALFYFFKGMPKKGIVLIAMAIILPSVIVAIFPQNGILLFGAYILPTVAAFAHANIDYYRKLVLGEDFWW
jgi:hypothetical protein